MSHNSAVKMLGIGIIVTSHKMSTFNMLDINVLEWDALMATPTLNRTLEIKRYARKRIFHGCLVRIEKSVPRAHCLVSLGKAL